MPDRGYPLPADEQARLQALLDLQLLDTSAEEAFDDLTRLAALICDTPIALVSLLDDERQWFKSRIGLEVGETPREQAFCSHAILAPDIFEVPDSLADPRFRDNPLVNGTPHIRFYAGIPVSSPDGHRVGMLCVIDRQPRQLSLRQREALQRLGQIATRQLALRHQAILQAREAALQRALLNSAGCALLCTDCAGRLSYLNPTASQLLGHQLPGHNLLGQPLHQLLDPRELKGRALLRGQLRQRPAPEGFAVLTDELEEHSTSHHLWTLRRADGSELPAHLTLSPMLDDTTLLGYLAVIQDLSQPQQLQRRLELLAAQVPGMLFQLVRHSARDIQFPYVSDGIRPVFGISPRQLQETPRQLFERIATEDLARVKASISNSARQLSPWQIEFRTRPTPDTLLWIEGRAMPQARSDGAVEWHGIMSDISERKRIEALKAEFIATVSHELRTPLTAISGALGLLHSGALGELPPPMQELLTIAEQNSQRLALLINDLLDMEKLTAGKMVFHLRRQALQPLLEEAADGIRSYAERFAVEVQLCNTSSAQVRVDRLRLQQVLANLLSNAAKFSPAGGQVRLWSERQGRQVRVCIEDHGPGIPEAFQARIFQRFAQADASDSRQMPGTGLGLAISKELIARMGGEIGFSTSPAGTTFWFRLPLSKGSPDEPGDAH